MTLCRNDIVFGTEKFAIVQRLKEATNGLITGILGHRRVGSRLRPSILDSI